MKGVILQPGYLPWLGFFNQMNLADTFVYLDDVQYDRRGWRNRNRIRGPNGAVWLTVPVVQKGRYSQLLNETQIDNSVDWKQKHLKSFKHFYSKSAFFAEVYSIIENILSRHWDRLIDLDIEFIDRFNTYLDIRTKTVCASTYNVGNPDKTGRLVEICEKAGIDEYISGPLCEDYMDYAQLNKAGITLYLHEYTHPEYTQRFDPFIPYLSIVDLLFNQGRESLSILKNDHCLVLKEEL